MMLQPIYKTMAALSVMALVLAATAGAAEAQVLKDKRKIIGERYVPTIWVDPDGCEHWVMDDGFEGYMSPHVSRDGIPVCRSGNVCGMMKSDQFFATNSAAISPAGRKYLNDFFAKTGARAYVITGHTDARGSDSANMDLSLRRAQSVAAIAKAAGAASTEVHGLGERKPIASNNSAAGMAKNRRVEIQCLR